MSDLDLNKMAEEYADQIVNNINKNVISDEEEETTSTEEEASTEETETTEEETSTEENTEETETTEEEETSEETDSEKSMKAKISKLSKENKDMKKKFESYQAAVKDEMVNVVKSVVDSIKGENVKVDNTPDMKSTTKDTDEIDETKKKTDDQPKTAVEMKKALGNQIFSFLQK